jgi:hypothetical protein
MAAHPWRFLSFIVIWTCPRPLWRCIRRAARGSLLESRLG